MASDTAITEGQRRAVIAAVVVLLTESDGIGKEIGRIQIKAVDPWPQASPWRWQRR
ncbi:MAG: hypothetical protein M1415_02270 [Firmicutes bacterium]|nr:hypothetical protein [Bacillota bacterium]